MEHKEPHLLHIFIKGLKRIMPGTLIALAVLGMLFFFMIPAQIVLVVKTVKSEQPVLCARMTDGEEWAVSYIHSVNKRPVYDYLRIEGTQLRIVRSRYDAFGAGMPEVSSPENPLRVGPDGWLEYTVNRLVPDVAIFVGRVAGHVLHLKGREIPFVSLARPGQALRFSVEKQTLYQTFGGGCLAP